MFARLLAIFLVVFAAAFAQQQDLLLRVLLAEAKEGTLTLAAHQRVTASDAQTYTAGTLRLTAGGGEVLVNGQGVGPWVEFAAQDGFSLGGRAYRGNLLAVWQNGQLTLVNRVWLEDYLLGVVPSEVPASFPDAVLQAQAILARTFALYRLNPDGLYDICASERCQVYLGRSVETPRHSSAVEATRSLIVSFDQKPITAVYHSDSGGFTAASSEVWGGNIPYLIPRPDPYAQSPRSNWERTLTPAAVAAALVRQGQGVGEVRSIQTLALSESGRPLRLRVEGSQRTVELDAVAATRLLRGLGLPSTRVRLEGWQVYGQGSGHGVGMSQWGARGLAQQGWDFKMILGYYYPGTFLSSFNVVVGLWDELQAMGYRRPVAGR